MSYQSKLFTSSNQWLGSAGEHAFTLEMPLTLRTAFIITEYYTRWVREKDSPFNFSINRGIYHGIMNVKLK